MVSIVPWALVLILLAGGVWGYFAYVAPAREFRDALQRIAKGDLNAPWYITRPGRMGGTVTDLKALSEGLRESKLQLGNELVHLEALLRSVSEGVLIVDTGQRITMANDSLERMFDLRVSWRGRTLMEVFRNHLLQEVVAAAVSGGVSESRQLTLDVRQGAQDVAKHFTITAAALRSPESDTIKGAIAIFHDITELKALEAIRRDFVANVSHELRTPLAIINGYLETLLDGALEDHDTAEKFLGVMWKHSKRLNLLIEDLLSLSQLETRAAGGLNFETVHLRTCLDRVVEQLEPHILERGAAVNVTFSAAFPAIEADPHRLDQVFFNLIENALKYGDAANPVIRISAEMQDEQACIWVADNGPGIPQADQPHIFERFYRVHKDRSRAVGGTGLGLSIVKHVVQAHGGQVAVSSQAGRGATFRIKLPASQQN